MFSYFGRRDDEGEERVEKISNNNTRSAKKHKPPNSYVRFCSVRARPTASRTSVGLGSRIVYRRRRESQTSCAPTWLTSTFALCGGGGGGTYDVHALPSQSDVPATRRSLDRRAGREWAEETGMAIVRSSDGAARRPRRGLSPPPPRSSFIAETKGRRTKGPRHRA